MSKPESKKKEPQSLIDQFKKSWVYVILASLAGVIIVYSTVSGALLSGINNTGKLLNIIHSSTATPVPTAIIAPLENTCSKATQSTIGFTYCIYLGHKGSVHAVAWSLDDTKIASAGNDGTVQVWEVATGKTLVIFRGHHGSVNAIAWSPDGKRIASAGNDGTVQIWLASIGGLVYVHGCQMEGAVTALAWSPDGTYIACGSETGNINVFYAKTGVNADIPLGPVHSDRITSLSWLNNSSEFASSSNDGTVKIWSVENGSLEENKPVLTIREPGFFVTALAWSPNGKLLAYAYMDPTANGAYGTVKVWDFTQKQGGNPVFDTDNVHLSNTIFIVNSLAWACDSRYLALGEVSSQVDIVDSMTQKDVYSYTGNGGSVNAVAWSLDGTKIASADNDGTVQIWEANKENKCIP